MIQRPFEQTLHRIREALNDRALPSDPSSTIGIEMSRREWKLLRDALAEAIRSKSVPSEVHGQEKP